MFPKLLQLMLQPRKAARSKFYAFPARSCHNPAGSGPFWSTRPRPQHCRFPFRPHSAGRIINNRIPEKVLWTFHETIIIVIPLQDIYCFA